MTRGGRRTLRPPQSRRLDLSSDLGTESTSAADRPETTSSSGSGPPKNMRFLEVQEIPPALPREPKAPDEPAWRRTSEIVGIFAIALSVVGAGIYLKFGIDDVGKQIDGVSEKISDVDRRIEDVRTTTTRADVQIQQVQSSINELSREVRDRQRINQQESSSNQGQR
jgi:hypothetical protein